MMKKNIFFLLFFIFVFSIFATEKQCKRLFILTQENMPPFSAD